MEHQTPKLIEHGTRYFFKEWLSRYHQKRVMVYHRMTNLGLFIIFLIVVGGWLVWKYYSKPDETERQIQQKHAEQYLADRVAEWKKNEERRERNERLQRAGFDGYLEPELANSSSNLITNLPAYENEFQQMKII